MSSDKTPNEVLREIQERIRTTIASRKSGRQADRNATYETYMSAFSRFLACRLTKGELKETVEKCLGKENMYLHNKFIQAIIMCTEKKAAVSLTGINPPVRLSLTQPPVPRAKSPLRFSVTDPASSGQPLVMATMDSGTHSSNPSASAALRQPSRTTRDANPRSATAKKRAEPYKPTYTVHTEEFVRRRKALRAAMRKDGDKKASDEMLKKKIGDIAKACQINSFHDYDDCAQLVLGALEFYLKRLLGAATPTNPRLKFQQDAYQCPFHPKGQAITYSSNPQESVQRGKEIPARMNGQDPRQNAKRKYLVDEKVCIQARGRTFPSLGTCWVYNPPKVHSLHSHPTSCALSERDIRTAVEINPQLITPDIASAFF